MTEDIGTSDKPQRFEGEQFVLDERTSDPSDTTKGSAWIRSDIAPETNQLGTLRVQHNQSGDTWDVPIFDTGTSQSGVEEVLRVPIGGTTGYIPIATPSDARFDQLRFQHAGSTHALHDAVEPGGLPSGAIAQYDATEISASDGDTISSWTDQVGTFDLSGGDPTYNADGLNNNPTLNFDGSDSLSESNLSENDPLTIAVVIVNNGTGNEIVGDDSDGSPSIEANQFGSNDTMLVGDSSDLVGNATNDEEIIIGLFDGNSSIIRQNGSQTNSGDIGNADFDGGLAVGDTGRSQTAWDGEIAEIVVYNDALSSTEISNEESRLSDKWGITI